MTVQRRGLGRGLGALIPTAQPDDARADRDHGSAAPTHVSRHASPYLAAVADATVLDATAAEPTAGAPTVSEPSARAAGEPTDITTVHHAGAGEHPAEGEPSGDPAPVVGVAADGYGAAADVGDASVEPAPGAAFDHGAVGARFAEIDIDAVRPNPRQPRQVFDEEALAELVHSIREVGMLQPVVVRELPPGEPVRFELVMGERRWRAAREAGLATIAAIIRDTPDTALLRDALLENLHRAELNPLEEAAAYDQLLQDFGCTQEELATRIGRSRPQISNTLRLLRLPPSVQRRLAAGVLSAGHARAILGVAEAGAQERLAQRVVAEGLSVRSVEEIVAVGAAETPSRSRAARTPAASHPAVADVAGRLAERLDTRVQVTLGRAKGKVTIDFATVEDLHRIAELIDPSDRSIDRFVDMSARREVS